MAKMKQRPVPPPLTPDDGKVRPFSVLTVYQSVSESWKYEIRVSHTTGITYCTCLGWRFHKKCTHLDEYKADPVFVNGTAPNAPAHDLARRSDLLPPGMQPGATAPAEALRAALAERGIHVTPTVARTVAQRVLEVAGAMVQPTAAPAAPARSGRRVVVNSNGVRVVILPD